MKLVPHLWKRIKLFLFGHTFTEYYTFIHRRDRLRMYTMVNTYDLTSLINLTIFHYNLNQRFKTLMCINPQNFIIEKYKSMNVYLDIVHKAILWNCTEYTQNTKLSPHEFGVFRTTIELIMNPYYNLVFTPEILDQFHATELIVYKRQLR
jgi:hypothetical protein